MKFVDEFRDPAAARKLLVAIEHLAGTGDGADHFKFMEVCGGHTHTIYRHGIEHLLPENVELVHGPGCPVCVIPMGRIDDAMWLAGQPDVIFTCFGDMMRVPGSDGSLLDAKARGADVRFVYSPLDALKIATDNPDKQVVFFAIGFETTAPSTAVTLVRARDLRPAQFQRVLQPRHDRAADQGHPRLTRPALERLHRTRPRVHRCRQPAIPIRAGGVRKTFGGGRFRATGHSGLGRDAADPDPRGPLRGGEPVLAGGARTRQPGGFGTDGQGFRAASALRMAGAGVHLAECAAAQSDDFADFDAELRYSMPGVRVADPKACQCGEVLKGVLKPWECKVFGTACTPETPIGTCMVSPEGACAAYYNFGRMHKDALKLVESGRT